MLEYPQDRPKVFAVKVTRQLIKTCAAATIGPLGFALVTAVAATEDRAGYKRAVTFYDSQLMMILGIEKQHQLASARTKAVKAGWLQYQHGQKTVPGKYFVTIPDDANVDDDAASDEGSDDDANGSSTDVEQKPNGSSTEPERTLNGSQTEVQPFFPMPSPVPLPVPSPEQPARARPGDRFDPSLMIPPELKTPEFTEAWQEWIAHRKDIKKPLTRVSVSRQMAEFIRWGPARAVAAIHYTVAKGWQGIVEPDSKGRANGSSSVGAGQRYIPGTELGEL